MNSSASTSFSISFTVKQNGIDDQTSNRKDSPLALSPHLSKEMPEKTIAHPLNIRRIRCTNGTIIRSKSFDNGTFGIGQRKTLNKSKTLSSIAHCPKKKRCVENGSNEFLDERHRENKRRRIFQSNIDQSTPLWITLTHAPIEMVTIGDFNFECWFVSNWNLFQTVKQNNLHF